MRLRVWLLVSHLLAAWAGVALLGFGLTGKWGLGLSVGGPIVLLSATLLGWYAGTRVLRGLSTLERAVSSGELQSCPATGLREIDHLAAGIREAFRHSTETTARVRQQSREVEELVAQLNRRSASGRADTPPVQQLRQMLTSLSKSVEANLRRIMTSTQEIENRTQEIAGGAGEQTTAVQQTTSFVEEMSANIDSVSRNAEAAHQAALSVREAAAGGLDLVRELIRGMEQIRHRVETGGRKLRALGDRSQEIGCIIETIGAISARTDMLALNTSIESVRAGEHGRGFTVVAEKVRKLAEQTAQATREVTGLIEAIQMETQNSIAAMAEEHAQVTAEVRRVNEAATALEMINHASSDSAQRVGDISHSTLHQLRVTQEVVLAMQRISDIAQGIRSRADGVCGSTKTLSEVARQLDTTLTPLRRSPGATAGLDTRRPAEPAASPDAPDDLARTTDVILSGHDGGRPADTMLLIGAAE